MRYLDEFGDPALAAGLLAEIRRTVTRPWTVMEVCGGQTHTIVRNGIDQLLPDAVHLVHGPGCPVCVTPLETIDRALAIAARPEVVFCTFGDMLRVPGSHEDLFGVRAAGGDVRLVYSPLDAVQLARELPDRQVVFLAVGFETTAPASALAVQLARRDGLANFSVLVSHVLVPPAMTAILDAPGCRVQGFLAAGHVCTVMGTAPYEPLVERHRVPIVVTGFEPLDVLDGLRRVLVQLEAGRAELDNAYPRAVRAAGNPTARAAVAEVFETCDQPWRGLGVIPRSGWRLAPSYAGFDAATRFDVATISPLESPRCRSGEVLQGLLAPTECDAFATACTPRTPLGAPMVSAEGACAAYFRYRSGP
ncbi:MAG: hydrogenase formation protein HypD [Acidimicrobiales bacterium]|nr:hydrogenase formation protein HypD [Acidimicrobiales bacterium]